MNDKRLALICFTILGIFTIGAVVVMTHTPDGGAASLRSLGLLISTLPACLTSVILLMRQAKVTGTVQTIQDNTDKIQESTDKILNGTMDEKIKRNVHEVLNEREAG
jgi:ABC-type siderophore export system fused ATPase/permease subunit